MRLMYQNHEDCGRGKEDTRSMRFIGKRLEDIRIKKLVYQDHEFGGMGLADTRTMRLGYQNCEVGGR